MSKIVSLTAAQVSRLAVLRESSANSWEGAIDGAKAENRDEAAAELSSAYDAWDTEWDLAMSACDAGDAATATEHLETCRRLAADGGDDSSEREALAIIAA